MAERLFGCSFKELMGFGELQSMELMYYGMDICWECNFCIYK